MAPTLEEKTMKLVEQGLDFYWSAPVSHASIPPIRRVPEPLPEPIEPIGWWDGCWFNPWKKKDIYDLPSIRQYDIIG